MALAQLAGQVGDRVREVDADDRMTGRGEALGDPLAEPLRSTGDHDAAGAGVTLEGVRRALVDGGDHGSS